ncbi:MAG TPA: TerC family protein [Terriglobales bacterium]|jgi:tellurite resistance protein TerC|nr:TerC family protein [Terriglobales bacterium]
MAHSLAFWIGFNLFVLAMLALDLGLHRRSPVMGFKAAMAWTGFWILLAAAFAGLVFFQYGRTPALQFITGYVVEESLSIDNLFVFLVLFRYFRVPREYQHKVLLWGVLGALVMRLAFILLGVSLLERFEFLIYVFGAILVYSGIGLLRNSEPDVDPDKNLVLRIFRKFFPIVPEFEGSKFFVRREGRRMATPLFLALLVVETTDLIFAVDSIPAILAITRDAFIVYTSNVFAILGLRSLYFALEHFFSLFRFLHYGLAIVLMLVGLKMLTSHFYEPPLSITLGAVVLILAASVGASLIWPEKETVRES